MNPIALRRAPWLLAAFIVFAVMLLPAGASAYTFGSTISATGPEEVVYNWSTMRCDAEHIPDSAARAFKDARGRTQLTISSDVNRRMVGPNLNQLSNDCTVTMGSDGNPAPSMYNDQEWIAAPYTTDGKTVHALVHNEYKGSSHPGMCPSGQYVRCWYNSITLATSQKRQGDVYTQTAPPTHLVASVPYQYQPDTGPYGDFEPSNIVFRVSDGYYYSLVHVEPYQDQKVGVCVMRTRTLSDPKSWRFWNGSSFNGVFINPYLQALSPSQHVCAPISYPQIEKMNASVTFNSHLNKYMLTGSTWKYDTATRVFTYGVYYSTSTDLINWSDRQLLMEAELPWSYQCGDDNPISYPVALDPASQSRNYETTGRTFYLYFTRHNYENCVGSFNRDLIRIPIRIN